MNVLFVIVGLFMMSADCFASSAFQGIPSTLAKQISVKPLKLKSAAEKKAAFEKIYAELKILEKDLMERPEAERPYESLTVFELQEFFSNIQKQGFEKTGCANSLKLLPYWADPKLEKIDDAPVSARFSHAVVKSICGNE